MKRYAREGSLRGTKLPGGWWKFTDADIDAFLAAHTNVREATA